MANGILWTGYPGQAGGTALAKILYGQVNPSGKLPMTFVSHSSLETNQFFKLVKFSSVSIQLVLT